jgi:hypothetical protein
LNLLSVIQRAGFDPLKLRSVRGLLTPILRDTLVGLNYIYYAPPGAQLLRYNQMFVRNHDFLGSGDNTRVWSAAEPYLAGWPSSLGGRLAGALVGLPHALAAAEQDFLVPSNEQALIWSDLVPQMILSAKVSRWWNVTPAELQWVGLHLLYGSALLAEASLDPAVRAQVLESIGRQVEPARLYRIAKLLEGGEARGALQEATPVELFALGKDMAALRQDTHDLLAISIRQLASETPGEVNYTSISRAFGTPKPTLASSYQPELLYLRTFPTLMGYSSRILAESWESNMIYWAGLAYEMYLPPAQMNVLVPQWTQQMAERIYATHLGDWSALLRSLRLVGEEARLTLRQQNSEERKASLK